MSSINHVSLNLNMESAPVLMDSLLIHQGRVELDLDPYREMMEQEHGLRFPCPAPIWSLFKEFPWVFLELFHDGGNRIIVLTRDQDDKVAVYSTTGMRARDAFGVDYNEIFDSVGFWNLVTGHPRVQILVTQKGEEWTKQERDAVDVDPRFKTTWEKPRINWHHLVGQIPRELIHIRVPEHEFMTDEREITFVDGYPLDSAVTVEDLANAMPQMCNPDLYPLKKHLYFMYTGEEFQGE